MIRINLLATERKKKKAATTTSGQKVIVGITLVAVATVGFLAWRYLTLTRQSSQLDADLAAANQERTRLQSIIQQVKQYEQRKGQLQERVQLIEQLRSQQTGPVHLLDQISRSLPQMLWLTKVTQDPKDGSVLIDGTCTTQTGVTEFVNNLEATNYFKRSIDIVKSDARQMAQPATLVYDFQIKALFVPPGAKPATGTATPAKTGA